MEENPNNSPNPAEEPKDAPAEAPTPEKVPEPTPETAPEPTSTPAQQIVPEPAPEAAFGPVSTETPAPTAEPATAPATAPAPKKKGGLIALIIGLAVLLLGGGAFAVLYFTSHTPNKLVESAIINELKKDTVSMSTTTEQNDMNVSIDIYAPNKNDIYLRFDGYEEIYASLLAAFGVKSISGIDNVWWKLDSNSSSSSNMLDVSLDVSGRDKSLAAYKKYPYLVAEPVSGKSFPTSGNVYKITIDKTEFEGYKKEAGDDSSDGILFGNVRIGDDGATVYFTVTSTLLGNATLTGVYTEQTTDSGKTATSINFEKDLSSAPSQAKSISELEKLIESSVQLDTGSTQNNSSNIYDLDTDDDSDFDIDLDDIESLQDEVLKEIEDAKSKV
ncbi:procyclic acidic repetitive family protein [Candidatus Saccharibacteria bacterium]|nr:procyclic acidic repetitive family protein [Candidatus Saccharibacteria bacterium]